MIAKGELEAGQDIGVHIEDRKDIINKPCYQKGKTAEISKALGAH